MPYRLDMNLQQTAALKAAISFWNKPHVKDKMIEFFNIQNEHEDKMDKSGFYREEHEKEFRSRWRQFTKKLLETWNYGILPKTLESELIHITKEIGRKIFDWSLYIQIKTDWRLKGEPETPEERMMYVSSICWTSYGTIDEVKTYETLLSRSPNVDVVKLYKIACVHALEDKVNYLWQKIPKSEQKKFDDKMRYDNNRHIFIYWKYYRDGDLRQLKNYFQQWRGDYDEDVRMLRDAHDHPYYDEDLSVEQNMLLGSIQKGHYNAVKYFWRKLTPELRDNIITESLHVTLRCYAESGFDFEYPVNYEREKWIEIFLFLMSQISADRKEVFYHTTVELMEYEDYEEMDVNEIILRVFPYAWPWQNLLIPVLNDMLQRDMVSDKMVYLLLCEMSAEIVENYKSGFVVKNSKLQSLFQAVWWNLPSNIKQKMSKKSKKFLPYYPKPDFISSLLGACDIDSINTIFNDSEVANVRNKFIRIGREHCKELIINDKYDVLDQLIETILRSDDEKTEFKKNINAYEHFVVKGEFCLADRVLDWQYSSLEEKQRIKSKLDDEVLSKIVGIMEQYDLADKFIDWTCRTKQEKKKCKDYFRSNFIMTFCIFKIWCCCSWSVDEATERCSRFLNWLFDSEYEIKRFLREDLAQSRTKKLLDAFSTPAEGMWRFFHWCGLTKKQIQQMMNVH